MAKVQIKSEKITPFGGLFHVREQSYFILNIKRGSQPNTASPICLEYNRPVPHARSGRDGRQEGRECSYYDLHCNLNNTLFHFLVNSFLILYSCLSLGSGTDVKSLATFSSGPDPSERARRVYPCAFCSAIQSSSGVTFLMYCFLVGSVSSGVRSTFSSTP